MRSKVQAALGWLALCAAAVLLFAPALETAVKGVTDFGWHARAAREWAAGGPLPTPHFLFQALLIAIAPVLPGLDWTRRAVLLALGCQVGLAVVVTALLRGAVPLRHEGARFAAAGALALGLLVSAPVNFGSWTARNLYHGYVGLAVYHNPTLFLLKPLAVLLSWEVGRAIGGDRRPPALLAALTILGALAKPSHLIALVPASAGLALLLARAARPPAWRSLLLGLALPAAAALAWQFVYRYGDHAAIVWAPLAAMTYGDAHLFGRLALSALFPLVVTAAFPAALSRDRFFAVCAATCAFGVAYAYLLAEGGDALKHRNFAWSAIAALFVLFVAATRTVLVEARREGRWRTARLAACGLAWALHVVCGVHFSLNPTWW